ncbi:MAG TPA: TadE family protein [Gemmataceae bacterium]|nr:TadE family protein [Gemmataceae bacterium]
MWIQRQGAHPGRAPAKKPRAGRPGAATVEFAVVAPVFFLLALGIIDVGRGLMVQHLMQNAARQGCRAGILPSNGNAEITAAVTGALQPAGISSESITVTVNDGVKDAKYASTGDDITVAVSVPVASVSWLPGTSYVKGNITAQYTMRKQ